MTNAILLSGGSGTRLGSDIPKQYIEVGHKKIIEYSIRTLLDSKLIDKLYIVAASQWRDDITSIIRNCNNKEKFSGFARPGANRQLSIYNALVAIRCDLPMLIDKCQDVHDEAVLDDISVLIHDAARPNLRSEMISSMVEALSGHDGVLPTLPMKDTVYMTDASGSISSLLDRQYVVAGQAPELFLLDKYLKANEALIADGSIMKINGSTEPAFIYGMDITTIPGDPYNYKITTREDLERFTADISQQP